VQVNYGKYNRWRRDRVYLLFALELFIKRQYVVLEVACSIDSTFYSLVSQKVLFCLDGKIAFRREIAFIHGKGLITL
jgi:hypothetical protein